MSAYSHLRHNALFATLVTSVAVTSVSWGTLGFAQDTAAGRGARTVPATQVSSQTQQQAQPDNTPPVAAVVNGLPISLAELAEQCRIRFGEGVLEDLVNKTAIMQACQAQNIQITEKDVNDEISRIALTFGITSKAYLKLVEDERGVTYDQYASDILWPMLALRALSKDAITITPEEIDREYQGQFGPKVKVRMIAIKDPNKLAQLRQKAVENPESFKLLAKEHSEDPTSASVEGLLPPIRRFTGDDELEQIAFSLKPNEVSPPFEAGGMHIILQCVQQLPAANPPAAQMQEIQSRIKSDLETVKLRQAAEGVYLTLREKSQINVIFGNRDMERQYPNVAAIVNGQSIPMESLDKICVKRYGKQILGGEINRKLIEGALSAAGIQITQQDVDQEIHHAATYYGVVKGDGTPDIAKWMEMIEEDENMTPDLYVRDVTWPTVALKKLTQSQVSVTEEDILKGYESNYGPRAEVLAIVLSNQRTAQQVWELARNNPNEQFFGELASQYSVEDSSRSNYGKVPPLRKHSGQPTLEKAAFELQPGAMSGIVEVNGRYIILRLQGFTTPVVSDMNDSIRAELHRELLEKKQRIAMDQYLTKLRENSEIVDFMDPKKSRVSASDAKAAMELLESTERR